MAVQTVVTQGASMQLVNSFTARHLVKPVNILGNNCKKLTGSLKLCKFIVSRIRFYALRQQLCPVKSVKLRSILVKESSADNLLRWIFPLLVIKTVHAAKIRNSRLCRNPGTTKKYNFFAFINNLL